MFIPALSWQSHSEYRTIVEKTGKKISRNSKYHFGEYESESMKGKPFILDVCENALASKHFHRTEK